MKKLMPNLSIAVIAVLLTISGCVSSGGSTSGDSGRDSNAVQVDDPAVDLTDYLRQFPSIVVSGSGANASISIRGISSMNMGTGPLFVLDGSRIGRNFADLYNRVRMEEVREVRVLRGAEAAMYGSEGANGVVVVSRLR